MEVARLQVAFDATGQPQVQRAIRQTDTDINRLAANSERSAGRIGSAFDGAGNAIKVAFGAVAAIGAGRAALGFLNINAQAEQLKVQLDIATGSAERANMVFGELQKMAAETPFEFPELVSASARIESFGIDSTKVLDTIGDTAAGTGKSIDQVTNAYLDAGMGQFIRLQELGIDAAVEGDKVKFKWIENGKEITKSVDKNSTEQIQATLEAIWNKKYEGAMKKQSKTFNGQLSTLKDNWNLTMGRLTAGFFDFSKGVLSEANEFFNLFNRKLDQGLDPIHAALSALHVTLDQVFGKEIGDRIDAVLRGIVDGAAAVIDAVVAVGGGLIDFGRYMSAVLEDGDYLNDWLTHLPGPIRGVAQAIGELVAAFDEDGLSGALGELGEITIDVAGWAVGQIPDLWDWLKGVLGVSDGGYARTGDGTGQQEPLSLGTILVDAALGIGGALLNIAADFGAWLAPLLVSGAERLVHIGTVLIDALPGLGGGLLNAISDFGAWLGPKIVSGAERLVHVGTILIDALPGLGGDLLTAATDFGAWLGPKLVSGTDKLVELGTLLLSATLEWAEDVDFATLASGVGSGIVAAIGASADFASNIAGAVKTKISELTDWNLTGEDFFNAGTAVGAGIRSAIAASVSFGTDIVTEVATALANADWSSMPGTIASAIETALTTAAEAGVKIAAAIGLFIAGAVTGIVFGEDVKFDDVAAAISAGIANAISTAENMGQDILIAIGSALGGAVDAADFVAEGVTIAGQIVKAAVDGVASTDFSALGTSVWNGIKSAVIGAIPADFLQSIVDAIIGGGETPYIPVQPGGGGGRSHPFRGVDREGMIAASEGGLAGLMGQATFDLPAPNTTAFTKAMTDASGSATKMQASVLESFTAMRAGAGSQIAATIATVSAGFFAMQATAVGATNNLVSSVLSVLSTLPGRGFSIGASLGQGIASGIQATVSSIASAAANAVNAAEQAARDAADIASPSRVFARIGAYMGEGLVVGMDSMQGAVAASMAGMVRPSYAHVGAATRINARSSRGGASGPTYIIQGDLLATREWERTIDERVASGAVKVVDRRTTSTRLAGR